MRILIVTQYFRPEMGAPPARLYELAVRLKEKGHQVTVLTGMPNRPTGRIFDGYRGRLFMEEDMEGVRVLRTWLYATAASAKFLTRLLCDLSFTFMSTLLALLKVRKQDVVIFQSPSLVSVLNGYLIGRLTRGKIVMWAGDIWPDVLIQSGQMQEGLATRLMYLLERFGYRHADMVALTNPGAAKRITDRFPAVKTGVWSNGVDTDFFRPDFRSQQVRDELGAGEDDFLVGYIGLHGRFQGLDAVLDAAAALRDRNDIRFVMMGMGVEKDRLMAKADEMNLANLTFHDPRPKHEIPPILASCDVSLVPLLTRMPGTMPSKPYEAFASGTPVIIARGCEGEPLAEDFQCGYAYEPMDGEEMADCIRRLADDRSRWQEMRQNCLKLSSRFDRDVLAARTAETLDALHEGRPLPPIKW